MAGAVYDHLLAVVLVGTVFVAAVGVLPNVGYVSFLSVDQQQLRNVAWSALNTMVLDAGYPTNWGSASSFNPASVVRFGLAAANDSGLYFLDVDKVFHLVEKDEWGRPNPMGYLPPDTMRQLLGLQAFGFNLKILAPFNVTVKDLAPPQDPSNPTTVELRTINYEVMVKYNDGKPIPNGVVSTLVFYSDEGNPIKYIKETTTTNALGKSTLVKSLSGQISDVVIIFGVTVGDIHTTTSVYRRGNPHKDIADINIIGDTINLTIPPVANPPENRWILSIDAYTEEGVVHLYNGTKGEDKDMFNWGNGNYDEWYRTFPGLKYMGPLVLIFNIWAVGKNQGRQSIIVVGPFPNYLGNRVLSYGTSEGKPNSAAGVTLQRVVNVAGMTYLVEFTLWKKQ